MTPAAEPTTRDDLPGLFARFGLTGTAVEVGVARGDFARTILDRWPGRLHLVDCWQHLPGLRDIANGSDADHAANHAAAVEAVAPHRERVELHRQVSVEAAAGFPVGSLDWVYLDASHTRGAVTADTFAWWPAIKPGGILAGHDYLDGNRPEGAFGVRSAVDDFARRNGLTVHVTDEPVWRSWWIVKPAATRIVVPFYGGGLSDTAARCLSVWVAAFRASGTSLKPLLLTDGSPPPTCWPWDVASAPEPVPPREKRTLDRADWLKPQAFAVCGRSLVIDADALPLQSLDPIEHEPGDFRLSHDSPEWATFLEDLGPTWNSGVTLVGSGRVFESARAGWEYRYRWHDDERLGPWFGQTVLSAAHNHLHCIPLPRPWNVMSFDHPSLWSLPPETQVLHFASPGQKPRLFDFASACGWCV